MRTLDNVYCGICGEPAVSYEVIEKGRTGVRGGEKVVLSPPRMAPLCVEHRREALRNWKGGRKPPNQQVSYMWQNRTETLF